MEILDTHEVFRRLCKAEHRWGVLIEFSDDWEEVQKAAPYLKFIESNPEIVQVLLDGQGILLIETEEEANKIYEQTVGDDGPTELNPYQGKCRVYALLCNPNGEFLNENT